jgi:hypothetical protein
MAPKDGHMAGVSRSADRAGRCSGVRDAAFLQRPGRRGHERAAPRPSGLCHWHAAGIHCHWEGAGGNLARVALLPLTPPIPDGTTPQCYLRRARAVWGLVSVALPGHPRGTTCGAGMIWLPSFPGHCQCPATLAAGPDAPSPSPGGAPGVCPAPDDGPACRNVARPLMPACLCPPAHALFPMLPADARAFGVSAPRIRRAGRPRR